jgi:hypothetical protein
MCPTAASHKNPMERAQRVSGNLIGIDVQIHLMISEVKSKL